MSQWRRIAIEAVPSCKRAIETAKDPLAMWSALYDELGGFEPTEVEVIDQIYAFASACFARKKPEFLAADVWMFFHYLVGGYIVGVPYTRQDLPSRISASVFEHWAKALKDRFSDEQYQEAMTQFRQAQR